MALMRKTQTTVVSLHNRVRLVRGGAEYFAELEALINSAVRTLHLQTYIFEADETGKAIAQTLMSASQRGVDVYMMVDGYASRDLDEDIVRAMLQAGIRFRFFEPVLASNSFYFGRRLHHKVAVADMLLALVGGVNISDRYNDLPGDPAWLDWAVRVEGEAAHQLHRLCVERWVKFPPEIKRILLNDPPFVPEKSWNCPVRIRQNDWVTRRNEITRSYLQLLSEAEQEIIIMSSYFLPGRLFRRYMSRAAKKGVRIRLILAGTSDVRIAKQAERYMYRWLFRKGIEVYEYPRNVLHGKIAVADRKWMTGGSYNVNNISAYASIELNVDVLEPAFASEVQDALESIIVRDCVRITEAEYQTRFNAFYRLIQFMSYETIRMIFFLFTFYFKQR
jgi:cardiolipin synthase A/B